MIPDTPRGAWVVTDVPCRLDTLGWSRWHQRLILALGITWILDGLEASLVANIAPTLRHPDALGLSATQIGMANSVYLVGQVVGALVFGYLTDRLGRKRLFLVTLALYLGATALSGLAPEYAVFLGFRFLAGAGIGGEYSAINSAIDEMVPARMRGAVALGINGSYWVGVAIGAGVTLIVLDTRSSRPQSAGAWPSGSVRCSDSASCSSGATCLKARAGCSRTATSRPRSRRSNGSRRRCAAMGALSGSRPRRSSP